MVHAEDKNYHVSKSFIADVDLQEQKLVEK